MCCTTQSSFFITLKVFAAITLLFGVLQFSYAVNAFQYTTNTAAGCWWGGLFVCLAAVLSFFAKGKGCTCLLGTALGFNVVACLTILAAVIVDGIWHGITDELNGCANKDGSFTGDNSYSFAASTCQLDYDEYDCNCVQETLASSSDGTVTCFGFDRPPKGENNCHPILTDMPDALLGSYICGIFAFIFCLIICIMSCSAVCCAKFESDNIDAPLVEASRQEAPAVVIVNPVAVTATPITGTSPYGDGNYSKQ